MRKKVLYMLFAAGSLVVLPVLGLAQNIDTEAVLAGKATTAQGAGETENKKWTREELLKLKQENPEKFKQIIDDKKKQIRKRLEDLKKNDPHRYLQLMQQIRERNRDRFERLKVENPEKFKEIMEARKRRFNERLERLKTEDPQKYERIMAQKEKLQELMRLKKDDPEKFNEFLKTHPRLRERLQDRWHRHDTLTKKDSDAAGSVWQQREDVQDSSACQEKSQI